MCIFCCILGVIDERCTIVSRIASNFFRFGSFEIFKRADADGDHGSRAGPSAGNEALKEQLLQHILLYYPEITNTSYDPSEQYVRFFREVVRRTAYLVAKWQCVGFVHGVLNTDNMSIMGLTIDYGPYGFVEHFDRQYVPNGSDGSARYSYQEQPQICKWNLGKLAEVLQPLLSAGTSAIVLGEFDGYYESYYSTLMGAKFGLVLPSCDGGDFSVNYAALEEVPTSPSFEARSSWTPEGERLAQQFFTALAATSTDFTDAFVALTEYVEALAQQTAAANTAPETDPAYPAYVAPAKTCDTQALLDNLVNKLVSRAASPDNIVQASKRKIRIHRLSMHPGQIEQIFAMLQTASPAQLSHLFGGAPVDAIRDEITGEKRKLDILVAASTAIKQYEQQQKKDDICNSSSRAVKAQADREHWAAWCNKYAAHVLQLASLSDDHLSGAAAMMRTQNPTFILRNWLAQDAIKLAEDSADYSGVRTLLEMLQDPFNPAYSTYRNDPATSSTSTCSVQGGKTTAGAVVDKKDSGKEVGDESEGSGGELKKRYLSTPPDWADSLICTCSS